MNITEFLKMEQTRRKLGKWFEGHYDVTNDHGQIVRVSIKQHGLYNQVLRFNGESVNYTFGHTIDKVGKMQEYLRTQINAASQRSD